ncbi:MAG: FeoB-associated Cys-rich membrane protein [Lachnospiraceae bacterium]|nr:FeoB-associated Cys-rich membrane protein [Lachnospiraceae bacterium]
MWQWIGSNFVNILLTALIVLFVGFIVRSLIRQKKEGGCSGCGSCSSCGCGCCRDPQNKG